MSADGRITPAEVQSVEFRLSFRGYNERDVDAFLDRITEDLSAYLGELAQLRGGAPIGVSTGGDADRAEAEGILGQARTQAAAIVRQAEQEAAAIRAGAAAGTGDTRAAVAPFLNTEREFLQSLGGLVQSHAEEIKQMVFALRSRSEGASPDAASAVPASPAPAALASPPAGATAAEIRERLGQPAPPPDPGSTDEAPIVIDAATEPAYSSEGAPANDTRERSLRELFWGED